MCYGNRPLVHDPHKILEPLGRFHHQRGPRRPPKPPALALRKGCWTHPTFVIHRGVSVSEKSEANDWPPGICILKRTSGGEQLCFSPVL